MPEDALIIPKLAAIIRLYHHLTLSHISPSKFQCEAKFPKPEPPLQLNQESKFSKAARVRWEVLSFSF